MTLYDLQFAHPFFKCGCCLRRQFFAVLKKGNAVMWGHYAMSIHLPVRTEGVEKTERLNDLVEPQNHVERTKLMRRNISQGISMPPQHWACHGPSTVEMSRISSIGGRGQSCCHRRQALICHQNESRYRSCATSHGAQVGLGHKASGMSILSRHDKNSHAQGRNGTNCLHPTGPVSFCQFKPVSDDGDINRAKNYEERQDQVGIFHACADSCLKGILA